jgi:hypothetical protein
MCIDTPNISHITQVVPYDDLRGAPTHATMEQDLQARTEYLQSTNLSSFNNFMSRRRDFIFAGQVDDRPGYATRAAYVKVTRVCSVQCARACARSRVGVCG